MCCIAMLPANIFGAMQATKIGSAIALQEHIGCTGTLLDYAFTWIHMDSLGFTTVNLDSLGLDSLELTGTHYARREKARPKGKRERGHAPFLIWNAS